MKLALFSTVEGHILTTKCYKNVKKNKIDKET